MTDDKDEENADPWAGLEAAGEGDAPEESTFSFDGLEMDAAVEAPVEDEIAAWLEPSAAEADAAASAVDSPAEVDFPEAVFAQDSPEPHDDGSAAVVSFPVAGDAVEDEEQAETLSFAANVADLVDGDLDAAHVDVMKFDDTGEDDAESEEAFAELETEEPDVEPAAVLAIGGSQVAHAVSKPKVAKKSGPGFLGPVLGGLLSLPIVFLILLGLLWGTGRDPIGMRSWLPSFLVPARNGPTVSADTSVANAKPPSLDDLAQSESAPLASDASEPLAPSPVTSSDPVPLANAISEPAIQAPSIENPLSAAVPVVPAIAAPESAAATPPPTASTPLDLSALEAAVDDAIASMNVVVGSQDGDPAERRRALVAWYKTLARVGAEMALVETAAADSGRPLDETPAPVMALYDRLGSTSGLTPDLKRLCRNWVDYAKRPADGVLLVGVLDAARQVGPFWYATIFLEQVDGSMRTVSLISRRQPRADSGDPVAVVGVVFSEDMVWAADCGRLAATAAPEAAVEDDPF